MTVEHLQPFLERPVDSELLFSLDQELVEASTPAAQKRSRHGTAKA